jgi:hypothetical protein
MECSHGLKTGANKRRTEPWFANTQGVDGSEEKQDWANVRSSEQ